MRVKLIICKPQGISKILFGFSGWVTCEPYFTHKPTLTRMKFVMRAFIVCLDNIHIEMQNIRTKTNFPGSNAHFLAWFLSRLSKTTKRRKLAALENLSLVFLECWADVAYYYFFCVLLWHAILSWEFTWPCFMFES